LREFRLKRYSIVLNLIPQQGEPKKALAKASAFFNEAHLRCIKNEAGLRPMKRAFGTQGRGDALRFMFAKHTHHASVASASYRAAMLH